MFACFFIVFATLFSGCTSTFNVRRAKLPNIVEQEHDQLVIHTDFRFPKRHRLVDQLTALRGDISERLRLKTSDEPIHIYLFENRENYNEYIVRHYPEFPNRRAFFVKSDTTLKVHAYWGERVAEDLRHEVTHGYLHAVVLNLPLWLDEGLAEYFEVPRGRHGFNWPHIEFLHRKFERGEWTPDLEKLSQVTLPGDMNQTHYAEAWLWTHFFLESEPFRREYLSVYINELVAKGEAVPLSATVQNLESNPNQLLIAHLKKLYSLQD